MGALCIKTAINQNPELPKATLLEHTLAEDPVKAATSLNLKDVSFIGLSCYIWNIQWFEKFALTIKKNNPNIIIFAGGPQTIDFENNFPSWLDFAVLGEGEISTITALKSIIDGKKAENLQLDGIVTKNYKPAVSSKLPDLSKLTSPFLSGEADSLINDYDSVLWEMTRGCPFGCAFCYESRGKSLVRDYPMDRIEKELTYLISHEIVNVFVLDPTFNLNPERAKQILKLLISKAPADMHFTFEIRAELLDEEQAQLFSQLNCSLQIGLQSSDEEVLKQIGRRFDKQLFTNKVSLLTQYGISFGLDIIIGLPKDNLKRFKNSINYAVSLMPSNIDCFVLSLLPGTELTLKAADYGFISDQSRERTIVSTPTFDQSEIQTALAIRNGMDLFYTKGQSCMWIHCILEALNITACNLFSLFSKWMQQTGRTEDEDIWILQDEFVESLFEKTKNNKLLPAMKSFMELHQGLCYVTETCEPCEVELSYKPDDLAKLDSMSLSEFIRTHKTHHCSPTIVMEEDGIKIY